MSRKSLMISRNSICHVEGLQSVGAEGRGTENSFGLHTYFFVC